jgi:hypothetical protein
VLAVFFGEISSKNHILGFGFKEEVMFFSQCQAFFYILWEYNLPNFKPSFFLNDSYLFKACIQLRILGELGYESI